MTCGYCGTRNGDDEHRCRRCGRKPDDTLTGTVASARTDGALATAVRPAPIATQKAKLPASKLSRPVQTPLFQASKVIPFEHYALPAPTPEPPRPRQKFAEHKTAPRKARPVAEGQARLDLLPRQAVMPRTSSTTGEAVIYCDAPVATPLHRAVATACDWALVLIAYGLFLLVFRSFGGQFILNNGNLLIFGGLLPLLGFTYGLVWVIAGRETAGMRWMRLRLTTFDGYRPGMRHRVFRLAGSCLGVCTVLGMLWSLADEESLGWQDHISHTFPTPCILENQIFRRS